MPIDKEASRRWRRRIREALNKEWDPIGVGQDWPDEYDAYVGKVAAMLREGASASSGYQVDPRYRLDELGPRISGL